ncbi:SCO3242 family prenyltransferase [Streptomyces sp. NPDC093252]|uniref:SCO3242 family prenyltransferase n=1 Tax=Streptomyces sp. NPDC093252 TaxID=3154980 RepID=UPI0034487D2B
MPGAPGRPTSRTPSTPSRAASLGAAILGLRRRPSSSADGGWGEDDDLDIDADEPSAGPDALRSRGTRDRGTGARATGDRSNHDLGTPDGKPLPLPARTRAWAELLRLPALFTVPGDALAGVAATGVRPTSRTLLAIGSSLCLYEAGMALNDWADRDEDAAERPHRPLPSGRIRPAEALAAAGVLTLAGLALAARAGRPALTVAAPLAATVWAYDLGLKHTPAGPVAMAGARALDLLLGAAATTGQTRTALPSAALLGTHTLAVTTVSRNETQGGAPLVPLAALAATALLSHLTTRPPAGPGDAATRGLPGTTPPPQPTPVPPHLGNHPSPGSFRARFGTRPSSGPFPPDLGGGPSPGLLLSRFGTRPSPGSLPPGPGTRPSPGRFPPDPGNGPSPAPFPPVLPATTRAPSAPIPPGITFRPPSTSVPPGTNLPTTLRTALALLYASTAARPYFHAALNPSPPLTQRAVGGGIRATIPLQAALSARSGAPVTALAIAALGPLAARFAKKVSVT